MDRITSASFAFSSEHVSLARPLNADWAACADALYWTTALKNHKEIGVFESPCSVYYTTYQIAPAVIGGNRTVPC